MRHANWPTRLEAVIKAARDAPFGYGVHDCVLFAATAIDAMTGEGMHRYASALYGNVRDAVCYLHEHGGLRGAVTKARGGDDPIPARSARRGDLVLFASIDQHGTLGICVGDRAVVPARPQGITHRMMRDADCAWRID